MALLTIIACSWHKPLIAVKTDNRKADKGGLAIAAVKCLGFHNSKGLAGIKKPANYAGDALMKVQRDPGIRDVDRMQENKILLQKGRLKNNVAVVTYYGIGVHTMFLQGTPPPYIKNGNHKKTCAKAI
jgi:hypothetical protein